MKTPLRRAFSARVTGIVQGVGFRYAAVFEARRLRIAGTVRNLPDGSVAVTAEGAAGDAAEFLAWLRRGPPGAVVREVTVEERAPDGRDSGFSVDY